jgi:hypothetical protein
MVGLFDRKTQIRRYRAIAYVCWSRKLAILSPISGVKLIDQPLNGSDRRMIFQLDRLAASLTFYRAA